MDLLPNPLKIKDQIHQNELLQSRLDKLEKLESESIAKNIHLNSLKNETLQREEKYQIALRDYEHLRQNHQLHEITKGLKVGDPCPVCARILTDDLPAMDTGELLPLKEKVTSLNEQFRQTEKQKITAEADLNSLQIQITSLSEEIQKLRDGSDTILNLEDLQKILSQISEVQATINIKREEAKKWKVAYEAAIENLRQIELQMATLWDQFDHIRDQLALLSPPASDRTDLGASVERFNRWKLEKENLLKMALNDKKTGLEKTESLIKASREEMVFLFTKVDLSFPDSGLWREVLIGAITTCENQIRNIEAGLKNQKIIQKEIKDLKQEVALHKQLGLHMKANAFERWLLQEAFKNSSV